MCISIKMVVLVFVQYIQKFRLYGGFKAPEDEDMLLLQFAMDFSYKYLGYFQDYCYLVFLFVLLYTVYEKRNDYVGCCSVIMIELVSVLRTFAIIAPILPVRCFAFACSKFVWNYYKQNEKDIKESCHNLYN